jgi:predicted nucleic acid-binding protein
MPDARFQLVVSVPLFLEYRAVLLRPENLLQRPPTQVEGFIDFLLSASHLQEVFFLWRPALPDPDDDLILELAVAAGCRYIVTHNLRDFRGTEKWGIAAVTPGGFLKLIEKTT